MNDNNKVAVIMTAYNEKEEWIRKSIESVLQQTYENLHIYILLDNPENDQLKKIIEEYAAIDLRITFIINEQNMGLVGALNKLISVVEEKYVARMDADDICDKDRIAKEMQFLEKYNLDFVMCGIDFIRDEKRENGSSVPTLIGDRFNECEKYGNFATHPTWLLKKEVYDRLEGYRDVKYCEDYDFVLRAIQAGFNCGRLEDVLLLYRVRSSGISVSYAYEQFEKADLLRECYKSGRDLLEIDIDDLNSKFDEDNETTKEKFDKAKLKLDKFAGNLYEHKLVSCIGIVITGFLFSSMFRKLFIDTFKNNMATRRIFSDVEDV